MRHDKLNKQLELLVMLTENRQYTIAEMCKRLNISQRSLYYHIESFKVNGLGVEKVGNYYCLSRSSRFISKLCDIVKFSEDEALTLKEMLESVSRKTLPMQSALKKLDKFYNLKITEDEVERTKEAEIYKIIYKAIKEERWILIKDYSSPHSQTISNRIVEPFLLFNNSHDLRAYEISSKTNKTFRLSRMGAVEMLETEWCHKRMHKRMYTDIFNFTSEESIPTVLRLDQLAYNVLVEEFPRAEQDITKEDFYFWTLSTNICSNIGIGRFILGMYDHIDILENDSLKEYIADKAWVYSDKVKENHITLVKDDDE